MNHDSEEHNYIVAVCDGFATILNWIENAFATQGSYCLCLFDVAQEGVWLWSIGDVISKIGIVVRQTTKAKKLVERLGYAAVFDATMFPFICLLK